MLRTLLTVVVVVLQFMSFKKNSLLINFKSMLQLIFSILILKNHWQTNNRFPPILIRNDIETQMSPIKKAFQV